MLYSYIIGKEPGMKMTKQQREELKHLKREANSPKSDLIDLIRRLEEISPREAEKLSKIVWKLESWQVK